MAENISIDKDGTVYVDGKAITPAEALAASKDVDVVWKAVTNRRNWNSKQIEKGVIYLATLITTTNVFGQIPIPTNVRGWIVGGAAFVLGAIHVSTPKAP